MERELVLKRLEDIELDTEKAMAVVKGLRDTFDNIVGINEKMDDWGLQVEVVEDYLKKANEEIRKLIEELELE